jgi:hypothetical protein
VDLRGLNEVGIYRISASEKCIRELKVQSTVTNGYNSYLPRFLSSGLWYHTVWGACTTFWRNSLHLQGLKCVGWGIDWVVQNGCRDCGDWQVREVSNWASRTNFEGGDSMFLWNINIFL